MLKIAISAANKERFISLQMRERLVSDIVIIIILFMTFPVFQNEDFSPCGNLE